MAREKEKFLSAEVKHKWRERERKCAKYIAPFMFFLQQVPMRPIRPTSECYRSIYFLRC